MGFSAITIPVSAFEHVVQRRMRQSLPEYVSADPSCVHAHITLLGPFAPRKSIDASLVDALAQFFATVVPFVVDFTQDPIILAGRWICLVPEAVENFAALTTGLVSAYPDYPPYGGDVEGLRPHLTLEYRATPDALREVRTELAGHLPASFIADHAVLTWYGPGATEQLASFPFSG